MSNEEALTEAVINQIRARLPDILRKRSKSVGCKIIINMPPGNVHRADIEFPPDVVRVNPDAQRT